MAIIPSLGALSILNIIDYTITSC